MILGRFRPQKFGDFYSMIFRGFYLKNFGEFHSMIFRGILPEEFWGIPQDDLTTIPPSRPKKFGDVYSMMFKRIPT